MIKVVVGNEKVFDFLAHIPVLNEFFSFDVNRLNLIQSEEIFARVMDKIRMGNGTYKTTKPGRFEEIDSALSSMLTKGMQYRIHDVAVSDGVTSTELYSSLKMKGFNLDFYISDKYAWIYVCEKYGIRVFRDRDKKVLFSDCHGILADKNLPRSFFLSKWLGKLIRTTLNYGKNNKKIMLLNPKTMRLIRDKQIHFKNYDILDSKNTAQRYDVIRCMNILNRGYFRDEQLRIALKNLLSTLNENGLFVVGRTDTNTQINYASIYRKTGNRLEVCRHFNGGTEIADLLV